jgi:hypothetical protein
VPEPYQVFYIVDIEMDDGDVEVDGLLVDVGADQAISIKFRYFGTELLVVPDYYQALFAMPVEMEDGEIIVDGALIDVSDGGSSASPTAFCLLSERAKSTSIGASGEELLYEIPIDLSGSLIPRVDAVVAVSGASTGTYRAYVGNTPGSVVGSALLVEFTTTSLTEEVVRAAGETAPVTNYTLLQITAMNDTPASCVSLIRGATVRFTS